MTPGRRGLPLRAVHQRVALVLLLSAALSGSSSVEQQPLARPSQGLLEVKHTPLARKDVPKELIELLEQRRFPYVRFYRTDVKNNTDRPIRVVWFDGFFRFRGPWIASNVRGRVLRTKDFLEWYSGDDMTADGWLRPGGTASCHVNWHWTETPDDIPSKWAYVAIDAQGNDYFAEAVVPDITPVKLR
jgi:hypothetical protein